MYKRFYNLQENPFEVSPNPRFLFSTRNTRAALAAIEHGIQSKKGFLVLTGEVGTGKTLMLRAALQKLSDAKVHTSFIFNPRLAYIDFLDFMLNDFGVVPESTTKSGMLRQLNDWLVKAYCRGETCVLVVDEAQNLSLEMLEEIRLLTNLEADSAKLLQIVLAGQPELEDKLQLPEIRQLRQRIAFWSRMRQFSAEDTADYINYRLIIAGRTEPLFTPEACYFIHQITEGIPRLINLLCEHSLIVGFADQRPLIDQYLVEETISEFGYSDSSLLGIELRSENLGFEVKERA